MGSRNDPQNPDGYRVLNRDTGEQHDYGRDSGTAAECHADEIRRHGGKAQMAKIRNADRNPKPWPKGKRR